MSARNPLRRLLRLREIREDQARTELSAEDEERLKRAFRQGITTERRWVP